MDEYFKWRNKNIGDFVHNTRWQGRSKKMANSGRAKNFFFFFNFEILP